MHAIWAWIHQHDPSAAGRVIRRMGSVFDLLADNPEMGRLRQDLSEGLRSFPVGDHIVFYRVTGTTVSVSRVLAAVRDIKSSDFES